MGRTDARGWVAAGGLVDPQGRLSVTVLVRSTVVYVTAPVALFLLGWLRAPLSWLAAGALAWAAWAASRRLAGRSAGGMVTPARDSASRSGVVAGGAWLLGGASLLVLVVSWSGAGGFGVQTWDWWKHNALLADLVAQPWPVAYRPGPPAGDLALVYYVAYYLPAAAAGKAAGWLAANVGLFLWTALGVVLAWQWLARLGRASPMIALPIVVLFTGFDLLGAAIDPTPAGDPAGPWWGDFHLEWWHGRFAFPGNVTLLAFAPHQALGGWLASALSLEALRRGVRDFPHALALGACLLWSPFAALGLSALLAAFVLSGGPRSLRVRRGSFARAQLSAGSLAALAATLPVLLYFAARWPAPALPTDLRGPIEAREAARLELLPLTIGPARFAWDWIRFIGLEMLPLLGALGAAGWVARRRLPGAGRFEARLLLAATVVLGLVPLVGYGFYKDWPMRVSIPALFALQVVAARALARGAAPRWARRALAAVLVVAALYPVAQLRSQVAALLKRGSWIEVPAAHDVPDLFALQRTRSAHYEFVEQYVARAGAPFFLYLARPVEPRPAGEEPDDPQGVGAAGSAGEIHNN